MTFTAPRCPQYVLCLTDSFQFRQAFEPSKTQKSEELEEDQFWSGSPAKMFSPRPSRRRRSSGRQQPPAEDAGAAAGQEQGRPEAEGSVNVQGLSLPSEIEATLDLPSPAPSNDDGSGVEAISRTPHNTPMSGVPSPNIQIPEDWSSVLEELPSDEYCSSTPSVSPTPSPPDGRSNLESPKPAPQDYWTSDWEVESRDGNYQSTCASRNTCT